MTATKKTFLLGGRPRHPWSGLCCIPYLLLLLMCVGCNHILFFLHVDNDLLAFVSFVSDFVQDRLWGPFVPLLDAATADALIKSDASDASDRKLIRKSDSLATAVKTFLKVESTFVTFVKVLVQAGFSLHLAILSSLVLMSVLGLITFRLFAPIAKEVQTLKSSRDSCFENFDAGAEEKARLYTASLQMRELLRALWKLLICFPVALAWYFLGARRGDIAIYSRLAHQISSAIESFEKMSQTLPKSIHILQIMSEGGGAWNFFVTACAAILNQMPRHGDAEEACGMQAPGIGYMGCKS